MDEQQAVPDHYTPMLKIFKSTDLVDDWAASQTHFWEHVYAGPRVFDCALQKLNDKIPTVFVLGFNGDCVNLREKPALSFSHYDKALLTDSALRAEKCLCLFRQIILTGMRIKVSIAFDVDDMGLHGASVPIFCYQKDAANRNILLPDIGFFGIDGTRENTMKFYGRIRSRLHSLQGRQQGGIC